MENVRRIYFQLQKEKENAKQNTIKYQLIKKQSIQQCLQ